MQKVLFQLLLIIGLLSTGCSPINVLDYDNLSSDQKEDLYENSNTGGLSPDVIELQQYNENNIN